MFGYDVREHKLITKDNYELSLHRLIHPEDAIARRAQKKKPYLLLHGLLGTSAGFITNARWDQVAPAATYDLNPEIEAMLRSKQEKFEHFYQSTGEQFGGAHEADKPDKWARDQHPRLASTLELNFENDPSIFASAFRQAHRKFNLPPKALKFVSNSLAFTLSNFGYDVWMINMRGNHYSKGYNGRLTPAQAEYWNFNIESQVREDLLATINYIKRENQCDEPIGLVSYSYSSIHVLNLLRKFPAQLQGLQPVIMVAPTLLTANSNPDRLRRGALRATSKLLVAKNGPFPSLGRGAESASALGRLESSIEALLCRLPIFSKFCRLLETVLYGRTKKVTSVKGLLLSDSQEALVRRENDCAQTSTAILHQIMDNLARPSILPQFSPQLSINEARIRGQPYKRSVMLVHSRGDEISTPAEVERIREIALRDLTLVDYIIESDKFGHTDFLFSRRNQYLVNAEIARMAAVYDFVLYHPRVPAMPLPPGSARPPSPPPAHLPARPPAAGRPPQHEAPPTQQRRQQ